VNSEREPVYMIGIASKLCGVHPQTLRQYERLGLVTPSRVGAKNRLYSEADIQRVKRVQRLTQEIGVNLAGVEIILRLLEDIELSRADMEAQFEAYRQDVEERISRLLQHSNLPIRKDEQLLPTPRLQWRKTEI